MATGVKSVFVVGVVVLALVHMSTALPTTESEEDGFGSRVVRAAGCIAPQGWKITSAYLVGEQLKTIIKPAIEISEEEYKIQAKMSFYKSDGKTELAAAPQISQSYTRVLAKEYVELSFAKSGGFTQPEGAKAYDVEITITCKDQGKSSVAKSSVAKSSVTPF